MIQPSLLRAFLILLCYNFSMKPIEKMMNSVAWVKQENQPSESGDLPYVTHEGCLSIGTIKLKCYRLSDGQAIFDADDISRFFG